MADFVKLPSGDIYVNLDHVYSAEFHSASRVTLYRSDGSAGDVEGDDARAILAHIRGDDDSLPPLNPSRQARDKAQELTQMLGGNAGRRFDFMDPSGQSRKATVFREGESWTAEVDGVRFGGNSSEVVAMQRAVEGAG